MEVEKINICKLYYLLYIIFPFYIFQNCAIKDSGVPIIPESTKSSLYTGPLAIYYGGNVKGDFIKKEVCQKSLNDIPNLVRDGFIPETSRFFGSLNDYKIKDLFKVNKGLILDREATEVYYYGSTANITPSRVKLSFTLNDLVDIDENDGTFKNSKVNELFQKYIYLEGQGLNEFYTFSKQDGSYDNTNNCSDGASSSEIILGAVGSGLLQNDPNSSNKVSLRDKNTLSIKPCSEEKILVCVASRTPLSNVAFNTNPIPYTTNFIIKPAASDSLTTGNLIPNEFSQNLDNNFPSLVWSSAPKGTKSFALTVTSEPEYIHLFIYNIPYSENYIIPKLLGPNPNFSSLWNSNAVIGTNTFPNINGGLGWAGTNAPNNTYKFSLFALGSANLPIYPQPKISELTSKIAPYSFISKAELVGFTPPAFILNSKLSDSGFDPITAAGLNNTLPIEFTWNSSGAYNAKNNFPKLTWNNAPINTKSFVLIVSNTLSGATHLVLYNIPANLTGIDKLVGQMVGGNLTTPNIPASYGLLGFTDLPNLNSQVKGWIGPNPGDSLVFALYAMRTQVTPTPPLNLSSFENNDAALGVAGKQILEASKIYTRVVNLPLSINSSIALNGFQPNALFPLKFQSKESGGYNSFPNISWINGVALPVNGTYALVVKSSSKVFGILYNIPSSYNSLPFTTGPNPENNLCATCSWASNSYGVRGWSGPGPSDSNKITFSLYALNNSINPTSNPTPNDFEQGGLYSNYIVDYNFNKAEVYAQISPPFNFTSDNTKNGFTPYINNSNARSDLRFNSDITVNTHKNDFPSLIWSSAPSGTKSYVLIVTENENENNTNLLLSNINHSSFSNGLPNLLGPVPNFTNVGDLIAGTSWVGFQPDKIYKFKLYAINQNNLNPPLSLLNYKEVNFNNTYLSNILGSATILARAATSPILLWSSQADGGFDVVGVGGGASTLPVEFNQEQFGGFNIFPKISWKGGPPQASIDSYVLAVTSGSPPSINTHLLLYGIPSNLTSLPKIIPNIPTSKNPDFSTACAGGSCGVAVTNTFGVDSWSGGNGLGLYTFKLYAISNGINYATLNIKSVSQFELGGNAYTYVVKNGTTTLQVLDGIQFKLGSSLPNGFNTSTNTLPFIPFEFNSDNSFPNSPNKNFFPFLNWTNINSAALNSYLLTIAELSDTGEVNLVLSNIPIIGPDGSNLLSIPKIETSTINFSSVGNPSFNYGNALILDGASKQWQGFSPDKTYRFRIYAMRNAQAGINLINFRHDDILTNFGPKSVANSIIAQSYIDAKASLTPLVVWSSLGNNEGFDSTIPNPTIPIEFNNLGQGGLNHFPLIKWNATNPNIKSFALAVTANTGVNRRTHLLIYDIPATTRTIQRTAGPVIDLNNNNLCGTGSSCKWALNYLGKNSWAGILNSANKERYNFTLFAMTISGTEYTKIPDATTIEDFEFGGSYNNNTNRAVIENQNINGESSTSVLQINSSPFANGGGFVLNGNIPANFNYDITIPGQNNDFPGLNWFNPTADTKSFALVITDISNPNSPSPNLILYDIPKNINSINKLLSSNINWNTLGKASVIGNDLITGNNLYWKGFEPNNLYRFKIFALSVESLSAPLPPLDNSNFDDQSPSFISAYTNTNNIVRGVSYIDARGSFAPLLFWSSAINNGQGFDINGVMSTEFASSNGGGGGLNSFPRISWSGGDLSKIKSYVLTVTRGIGIFSKTYLILYDIPNTLKEIPKIQAIYPNKTPDFNNACASNTTNCGKLAVNSWGSLTWAGTDTEDNYTFKLYAMTLSGAEYVIPITDAKQFESNGSYNTFTKQAVLGASGVSISARGAPSFNLTSTTNGFNGIGKVDREFNALDSSITGKWNSNSFPDISWSNIPNGTASLVLIISNKSDSNIANLILYDIAPNVNNIPYKKGPLHNWSSLGKVELNTAPTFDGSPAIYGWTGFAPSNTYKIRLYALNVSSLSAIKNFNNADVSEDNFLLSYSGAVIGNANLEASTSDIPLTIYSEVAKSGFNVTSPLSFLASNFSRAQGGNNDFPSVYWSGGTNKAGYVLFVTNSNPPYKVNMVLYNIPSDVRTLPFISGPKVEQSNFDRACINNSGNVSDCGILAKNAWNTNAWYAPEDSGNSYTYTLVALDNLLPDIKNTNPVLDDFNPGRIYSSSIAGSYIFNKSEIKVNSWQLFSLNSRIVDGGFNPKPPNTIPIEFTTSDLGNFPYLEWNQAPSGTTNYTLIIAERKADGSLGEANLLLYDIPATTNNISKIVWSTTSNFDITGGITANNSFNQKWTGFLAGRSYSFKLFAQKNKLSTNLTSSNYKNFIIDNGSILNGNEAQATAILVSSVATTPLNLSSSILDNGFDSNADLPEDFLATPNGNGYFPKITWQGGRGGSSNVSYVLSVTNTFNNNQNFLLYNIPGNLKEIPLLRFITSDPETSFLQGCTVNGNPFQKCGEVAINYNLGEVASNTKRGQYKFKLYALNNILGNTEIPSRYSDFEPGGKFYTYVVNFNLNTSEVNVNIPTSFIFGPGNGVIQNKNFPSSTIPPNHNFDTRWLNQTNTFPELWWKNPPLGTTSMVLVVKDDSNLTNSANILLYDINPQTEEITNRSGNISNNFNPDFSFYGKIDQTQLLSNSLNAGMNYNWTGFEGGKNYTFTLYAMGDWSSNSINPTFNLTQTNYNDFSNLFPNSLTQNYRILAFRKFTAVADFALSPPINTTLTVVNTFAKIDWFPPPGATGFNLYKGTTNNFVANSTNKINTSPINSVSYSDPITDRSIQYYYRVTTLINLSESVPTDPPVTLPLIPPAPTLLTATANAISIDLKWQPSLNTSLYKIYRSVNPNFISSGTPTFTTLTNKYSDTTFSPSTVYYYAVVSSKGGVDSTTSSNTVSALSNSFNTAPIWITIKALNITADLFWSSLNGASYNIYRSATKGFTPNASNLLSTASPSLNPSYRDINLLNGNLYYYRVSGKSNLGVGLFSDERSLLIVPAPPNLFTASVYKGYISLAWNSTFGSTSYTIKRYSDANASNLDYTTTTNILSLVDNSVIGATEYFYTVIASNAAGDSTTTSPTISVFSYFVAPTGLTLTAVNTIVSLNWNSFSGVSGYNVYRSETPNFNIAGTRTKLNSATILNTNYIDNTALNGKRYYYSVAALKSGRMSDFSDEENILIVPTSPSWITAKSSFTDIKVEWNLSFGATSNKIYRSTSSNFVPKDLGVGANLIATVPIPTFEYTDNGTSAGNNYYYTIISSNASGDSVITSSTFSVISISPKPTWISIAAEDIFASLYWNSNIGAESYDIYRNDITSLDTSPDWNKINPVSILNNTFVDNGLSGGKIYYYKFVSKNSSGSSPFSEVKRILTKPYVPTWFTVKANKTTFELSWSSSLSAVNYKIFRTQNPIIDTTGNPFVEISAPNSQNQHNVIPDGTTYYYAILSENSTGVSTTASTFKVVAFPPAVTWNIVTYVNTMAGLSWNTVISANSYDIYRSLNSNFSPPTEGVKLNNTTLTTSSFKDQNLNYGLTYYYKVIAINESGESNASNNYSILTIPPPPVLTNVVSSVSNISLKWQSSLSATSYTIYRSTTTFTSITLSAADILSTVNTPINSFEDSNNLVGGTEYFYTIVSRNASGDSITYSNVLSATSNFPAPTLINVTLSINSATIANLNWKSSSGAISYNIYRSTSVNFNSPGSNTPIATSNNTNYSDTTLDYGTRYYYRITATKGVLETLFSNQETVLTIPTPPSNFTFKVNSTNIVLNWNTTLETDNFLIYRSTDINNLTTGAPYTTITSPGLTYTDSALGSSVSYYYTIISSNATGNSTLISKTIDVLSAPFAPANVSLSQNATNVNLTWDSVIGADTYNIYRSTTSGFTPNNTNKISPATLSHASFLDTGLLNGTNYFYRLSATNASAESVYTNEFTILTIPLPPATLIAVASYSYISLSWSSNENVTNYKIYRSLDSSFTNSNLIANIANPSLNYNDAINPDGTTYFYRIYSNNTAGDSTSSSTIASATAYPTAPSLISATVNAASITINWNTGLGASNYKIQRATDLAFTQNLVSNNVNEPTRTFIDNGIASDGTTYYYRIYSNNVTGDSEIPSNVATALVYPSAPTTLSASVAYGFIQLSWNTGLGAQNYKIYRATSNSFANSNLINTVNDPALSVNNTVSDDGTTYYYFIKSSNTTGDSATSTSTSATAYPTAPSLISATVNATSITINWNTGLGASTYKIQRATDLAFTQNLVLNNVNEPTRTFIDTPINADGTTYYYRLYSNNVTGDSEIPSNVATALVFPSAPTTLSASVAYGFIQLSWNTGLGTQQYKIYRATSNNFASSNLINTLNDSTLSVNNTVSDNGTTYYYWIKSSNTTGDSSTSTQASATAYPTAPSLISATVNATSITINWNTGLGASTYKIQRATDLAFTQNLISNNVNEPTRTFIDNGIASDGTTYYYRIYSNNVTGDSEIPSNVATALVYPSAPTTLSASVAYGFIQLSWNTGLGAQNYKIYRATSNNFANSNLINTVNVPALSVNNTVSDDGTTYYYFIKSSNTTGDSSTSTQASATAYPTAPSLISATVNASSITINWNTGLGASKYIIQRATDNSFTQNLVSNNVNEPTRTYVDNGIASDGTTYYYRLYSNNVTGDSEIPSNIATALVYPSAPTTLSASVAYGFIQLSWNTGLGAQNYKIFRATSNNFASSNLINTVNVPAFSINNTVSDNGTTYYYFIKSSNTTGDSATFTSTSATAYPTAPSLISATVNATSITINWNTGLGASTYKIQRATDLAFTQNLVLNNVNEPTRTFIDTPINADGTTYYYRIYSNNVTGDSEIPSNVATALVYPSAPTTLSASVAYGFIQLSWNTGLGAQNYKIFRATSNSFANSNLINTVNDPALSVNNTVSDNGTTYYYFIKSSNTTGDSSTSTQASATAYPTAPSLISATVNAASITINWNTGLGASTYKIQRATDLAFTQNLVLNNVNEPTRIFVNTPINADGTTYYYRIYSNNVTGDSEIPSNVATALVYPSAPTTLSASVAYGFIQLSWNTGLGAQNYKIFRATSNSFANSNLINTVNVPAFSINNTVSDNGTTYYYFIKSSNTTGDSATFTSTSATAYPTAPSLISATVNATSITINWNTGLGASTYKIQRATDLAFTQNLVLNNVNEPTRTFIDTPINADGTTYYYRIYSNNVTGDSEIPSNVATALVYPSAPTTLSASVAYGFIQLSWNTGLGAQNYKIFRATSNSFANSNLINTVNDPALSVNNTVSDNGTTYYYFIKSSNTTGDSATFTSTSATAYPTAPSLISATVNAASITINWNTGLGASTYKIQRATDLAFTQNLISNNVNEPTRTFINTPINADGTTYYYRIYSNNTTGESQTPSTVATAKALPSAPTILSASVAYGFIQLSWNTGLGAQNYKIFRATSNNFASSNLINTVNVPALSINNTVSDDGTTYYYFIKSSNTTGDSATSTSTSATAYPTAPSLISATVNATSITINWNTGLGASTYKIQRATDLAFTQNLISNNVNEPTRTFINTPINADGTTYYYRIYSSNVTGDSEIPSDIATAKALPTAPTILSASVAFGFIQLSWNTGLGAQNYKIFRATSNSFANSNLINTVNDPTLSVNNTVSDNGTTYYYFIKSSNTTGDSATSTSTSETAYPTAPTTLSASVASGFIQLKWNTGLGASTYKIQRATDLAFTQNLVSNNVNEPTRTFINTPINADGTTYYYRIYSNNTTGDSEIPSDIATAKALPTAPTILSASVAYGFIQLSWNSGLGAQQYKIYRATSNNFASSNLINTVNDPTLSVNNTVSDNGTTYYYFIKSSNATGDSSTSAQANATAYPSAPTMLSASLAKTFVHLTWDVGTGATNYKIFRSTTSPIATNLGNLINTVNGNSSYDDTTIIANTLYYYSILSNNTTGDSAIFRTTNVLTYPTPVSNFTLSTVLYSTIANLNWNLANNGATNYFIYRATNATPLLIPANRVGGNSIVNNNFNDTVRSGFKYYYLITSNNATGESDPTTPFPQSVTTAPNSPTMLIASLGGKNIYLNWGGVTSGAGSLTYKIYRATTSGSPIAGMNLIGSTANTNYTDTSTTFGGSYYFKVVASYENVDSQASNEINVNLIPEPIATFNYTQVANNTFTKITFTWSTSTGATGFTLYKNNNPVPIFQNNNVTTYTYNDTSDGNLNTYKLYAVNPWASSGQVALNILNLPTAPLVSINVNTISWVPVNSSTSYKIYRGTISNFTTIDTGSAGANQLGTNTGPNPLTNFIDNTFDKLNSNTYYYKVKALNGVGESLVSDPSVIFNYVAFSISPNTIEASVTGKKYNLIINSSLPWTILHNTLAWVTLSKTSGSAGETITVTLNKDIRFFPQDAVSIPFSSNGVIKVLTINQVPGFNSLSTPGTAASVTIPSGITTIWVTLYGGDGGRGGDGSVSDGCTTNGAGQTSTYWTSNYGRGIVCELNVSTGNTLDFRIGALGGTGGNATTSANGSAGIGGSGSFRGSNGSVTTQQPSGNGTCRAGYNGGGGSGGGYTSLTYNSQVLAVNGGIGTDGGAGGSGSVIGTTYIPRTPPVGGAGEVAPTHTLNCVSTSTPTALNTSTTNGLNGIVIIRTQ